jgi:hypothetical protein
MFSLIHLPTELLIIILDKLLLPRTKDITVLLRLTMVNKRFRQVIYSNKKYWMSLKLNRSGSNHLLGPVSDDQLLEWITRTSIYSYRPVSLSDLLIDLDLSYSKAVSSNTIIFILKMCPNVESFSCFNCPWVFPSELRVGLAKHFNNSPSESLALKSFDIDFCGGASTLDVSSVHAEFHSRSSHPFRISGNSRLRLALNHSLSWSAHFYDICHIEYMLMRISQAGSDFELNPHPCPSCHTQIARRSIQGSGMVISGLCIRCEARQYSQKRRSEYRIPVL